MVSMCAARYRWERFLGITLAMHHKMDVDEAQFFDCFNECFDWFFSCWNVQMILNVTCKSGHVQLSCLRTFKICWPSAMQLSISNSNLNIVDYFVNFIQNSSSNNEETILSHGILEVVATRHRLQRLWGRIVTSIFWNQIKSTQILTKASPQGKQFSLSNCT